MGKRTIKWAAREKRRQTNKAIGGSFLKTLTELLTNSDSAIKRYLGLSHSAGLVDAMLQLQPGERLDTARLKKNLPRRKSGRITVELYSKQDKRFPSRTCRVIDYGPGMSEEEFIRNFGDYAKAKAKGQRTRSLFGRGALDVFLYHSNQQRDDGIETAAQIFSVKNGELSHCKIYWGRSRDEEDDSIIETKSLGMASATLLTQYNLPPDLVQSGTLIQFVLAEGTRIPQEGNLLPALGNFYMLRLIAADPTMEVLIRRHRTEGWIEERLAYDFDLGTVLAVKQDVFRHERVGEIPVDLLVARSERKMVYDPGYERRENGLLVVDDDDAVLDLTLLPAYDRNPFLSRIYGIVRLSGIREKLEKLLEAQRPEAVLTETRDGLDQKNPIVQSLFDFLEAYLKPIYEKEEQRERRRSGSRSAELDRRLKDALRELNRFHNDETGEGGTGKPNVEPKGVLGFSAKTCRLISGQDRRVTLFVEREQIHRDLNIVELTSSNPKIRVVPQAEKVVPRKGSRYQSIPVTLSCSVTEELGVITASAMNHREELETTTLEVLEVNESPQLIPPLDLEFRPVRFYGKPHIENHLILLANLDAFPGMPLIKIRFISREGSVELGPDRADKLELKMRSGWVISGSRVGKVVVPYWGTAWGSRAEVEAKAKKTDGKFAVTRCKIEFREQVGGDQYEDIIYEPLDRPTLGEAAGKYIYVNANPPVHKQLFGDSQESFEAQLEVSPTAQMRIAAIVTEAVVYSVASTKYQKGGDKGLTIDSTDPVTAVREFIAAKQYELDAKIVRAFVKSDPKYD